MKILLSSFGTRGDVQPYLALAVGLQRAGHQVTLSTSRTFSDWIHAYGVRTQPIRLSMQEVMQQPEVQAVLRSKNLLRQILLLRKVMGQSSEMADVVWRADFAERVAPTPAIVDDTLYVRTDTKLFAFRQAK